ncbi:MAG TPA: hypothetical protein VNG90_02745 [Candidatus Acidoferrum sp.]|nr:hypothetical protein [Candidatus Acidoferrum sp.]
MSIWQNKKEDGLFIRRHQSYGARKILNSTEAPDTYVHRDDVAPRLAPRSGSHVLLSADEDRRVANKEIIRPKARQPKKRRLFLVVVLFLAGLVILRVAL